MNKRRTQAPSSRTQPSETPPKDKDQNDCRKRLSKDLPGGKGPPADRGDCERESTSQGSE